MPSLQLTKLVLSTSQTFVWPLIIDLSNVQFNVLSESTSIKVNWFLKDFIDGHNGWNPDFA